jgi:hypothetical protein
MEVRSFKMHENLLYNIITRQAGSIEKAWLEALMNSLDSGSRNIEIYIDRYRSGIKDDGRGMNEEEIKNYFEIFGLTIDPRERKKYGEFRMGRGQMFAQGKNTWKTQDNIIFVDIKSQGLDYNLSKSSEWVDGCDVEVRHYDTITTHDTQEKIKRFARWIRYVDANVLINDEKITQNMKELYNGPGKYYFETDAAKYGLDDRSRGVTLYNKDIFVRTIWNQGIGGDASSKKTLKVNFGRNDIMYDCPVWRQIQQELKEFSINILNKKTEEEFTDENRLGIAKLIVTDEEAKKNFYDAKIFRTADESWVSLADLEDAEISFAKLGDVTADKVRQETGIIFLDEGSVTGNLRNLVMQLGARVIGYADAISLYENPFKPVLELTLNKHKKYNLEIARHFREEAIISRKIMPATITCTDGQKYIFLGTDMLDFPIPQFLIDGIDSIIHEESHEKDTRLSNVHGESFLRRFHDNIFIYGNARARTITQYLKDEDREEEDAGVQEGEPNKKLSLLKKLLRLGS